MRRAGKSDANQPGIVAALRQLGASVQVLSAIGKGCPDLLIGWHGRNLLLEVKDEDQPAYGQRLTPDQVTWHEGWRGQVAVVHSLAEALAVLRNIDLGAA